MGAEEARDLRVDEVDGAVHHLVLVEDREKLFVGVRRGGKALFDFGDVLYAFANC